MKLSLRKLLTQLFVKVVTVVAVLNNAIGLQAPAVLIRCSVRGTLHTTSQTSICQDSLYMAELHFAVGICQKCIFLVVHLETQITLVSKPSIFMTSPLIAP